MSKYRSMLQVKSIIFILVILSIILIFSVIISQIASSTPKIIDSNGQDIMGSIATLEQIEIGDSKQWITIRGKDNTKPILLFLAGGPGGSQLVETRSYLKSLEDHFVIVNWDQPGSGKSFSAVPKNELTPQRYIYDAHKLTSYLKKRFNREKIFLLGQSWGSALGIWLVDNYPDDYYAYIGSGQMVSFKDTEDICYEKALEIAKSNGDDKIVKELEEQGTPPYYGRNVVWKESKYLMYLSKYMAKNPKIHGSEYNTLNDVMSNEYGFIDKVNYFRGILSTFNNVYQQLYGYDLRQQNTSLEVPVYFIHGEHDLNAPTELVREYYDILQAPKKELIWFSNSGHSPWRSETDLFVEEMIRIANEVAN